VSGTGPRVVILSYGDGGQYLAVLETLRAAGVATDRVLVVHNPSTPGERPPGDGGGCELIVADRNLGYAAAMNLGMRRQLERDSELLLLLTHDAHPRPGSLEAMVAAARENPEFAVLGPVLMLSGTEVPYSYGGIRRRDGSVGHRAAAPLDARGIWPCDWVDGGTMLVRTDALRPVGGFDERFWGYTEEAELCLRIARSGSRIGVVLGAEADQDPGGPKRPGPWAYLLTRNGLAYARESVGRRGVAFILGRAIFIALAELPRVVARGAGLRPGPAATPWAVAVGTSRGIVDYFRGRWGAPPADLPGAGDVGNLGSEEAGDGP
jgi:GT2 family glycosyltransferase